MFFNPCNKSAIDQDGWILANYVFTCLLTEMKSSRPHAWSITHIFQAKLIRLVSRWSSHVPVSLVVGPSSSTSQHNLALQIVKTANVLV